jgi:hypothetical protein
MATSHVMEVLTYRIRSRAFNVSSPEGQHDTELRRQCVPNFSNVFRYWC